MSLLSQTVTIASGQSLSGSIFIGPGRTIKEIIMPSAWTVANLSFQVSHDGTTFVDLYNKDGTETVYTAAASRGIIAGSEFSGTLYLKIRSGLAAVAVNQGAQRDLLLIIEH